MLQDKGWIVYSVDPLMKISDGSSSSDPDDPSHRFADVDGVRIIKGMIEDVRINCNRAIIVMMHCHVTLNKVLESINAKTITGVVCCPCCNWSESQRVFNGRKPDVTYNDENIFTKKNEIRVWRGEWGERPEVSLVSALEDEEVRKKESSRFERAQVP